MGDYKGQIAWGLAYIKNRYTSPDVAEAHERSNNWYSMAEVLEIQEEEEE